MIRITCSNGNHTYLLSSSTVRSEDNGAVTVYGIEVIGSEGRAAVEDISDNFDTVRKLFDMIVEEELYPIHLADVVEDCLSRRYPKVIPISRYFCSPSIA